MALMLCCYTMPWWLDVLLSVIGLLLGYLGVKLTRLSFKETKQAREDIARHNFRIKQEEVVAKLVKGLNNKMVCVYSGGQQIYHGNVWGIVFNVNLKSRGDANVGFSKNTYNLIRVDDFLYDVYLPSDIASALAVFAYTKPEIFPYDNRYVYTRTNFDEEIDEASFHEREKIEHHGSYDCNLDKVYKVINAIAELKKSFEHWYVANSDISSFNLITIDNTKNENKY